MRVIQGLIWQSIEKRGLGTRDMRIEFWEERKREPEQDRWSGSVLRGWGTRGEQRISLGKVRHREKWKEVMLR